MSICNALDRTKLFMLIAMALSLLFHVSIYRSNGLFVNPHK
jgi:hypothetical protein